MAPVTEKRNYRMNEDRRKELRTQGRYRSENGYGTQKPNKKSGSLAVGKKKKEDLPVKSAPAHDDTMPHVVWCDENDEHKFPKLEKSESAKVISDPGFHVLSNTENGESRIYFEPDFIPSEEAHDLLKLLYENVKWYDKNIVIRGQEYPQPRLVAWYGPLPYSYSGVMLKPRALPQPIVRIKTDVEYALSKNGIKVELNSVLLNLYRNGKDSVAWHSDDESSMGICPTIASVSLGEVRRFELRRKPEFPGIKAEAEYVVHLNNGSLIVMDGVMQQDWLHRVPKEFHDKSKRINLTFRYVYSIERVPRAFPTHQGNVKVSQNLPKGKTDQVPFELEESSFPGLSNSKSQRTAPLLANSSERSNNQNIEPIGTDSSMKSEDNRSDFIDRDICPADGIHSTWDNVESENTSIMKTEETCLKGENDSCSSVTQKEGKYSMALKISDPPSPDLPSQKFSSNLKCHDQKLRTVSDKIYMRNKSHSFLLDASDTKSENFKQHSSVYNSKDRHNSVQLSDSADEMVNSDVVQCSDIFSDSEVATSSEHVITSSQIITKISPNLQEETSKVIPPETEEMQNCFGINSQHSSLPEYNERYQQEGHRLASVYNNVYTNWAQLHLNERDKEELDVLLTVINFSGPLCFEVLVSIADRMERILYFAEKRYNKYKNYHSFPNKDLEFFHSKYGKRHNGSQNQRCK